MALCFRSSSHNYSASRHGCRWIPLLVGVTGGDALTYGSGRDVQTMPANRPMPPGFLMEGCGCRPSGTQAARPHIDRTIPWSKRDRQSMIMEQVKQANYLAESQSG